MKYKINLIASITLLGFVISSTAAANSINQPVVNTTLLVPYIDCSPKQPETAETKAQQAQIVATTKQMQIDDLTMAMSPLTSKYNAEIASYDVCSETD